MNKLLGILLLAAGVVALVYGFQGADSLKGRVDSVINGSADKKISIQLAGGAAAALVGVGLVLIPASKKKK